jgi:hypothetical protein
MCAVKLTTHTREAYTTAVRIYRIREDRIALSLDDLPESVGGRYSIAKPINDVLGLRNDDRYAVWLEQQWGELAPSRRSMAQLAGARDDLERVAVAAMKPGGTTDYGSLAPLLSQVARFPGRDEIEVPSLAALAAWALERELDRNIDPLITCPSCQRPWFARGSRTGRQDLPLAISREEKGGDERNLIAAYNCQRPAPGLTMTCAQLHAHDRFAREREEWSKEYRKVMARKVRGSVSEEEFRAWKSVAKAGERGKDWTPFDEWKARQA